MNVRSVALSLTVALGLTLPAYAQQTAVCKDDTNWSGTSRSGACARHGGVKEWTTTPLLPRRPIRAHAAVPPSTRRAVRHTKDAGRSVLNRRRRQSTLRGSECRVDE